MSKITRDLLAVQVSTVSSKSAFSCGGRLLDSFRSSLLPRMVEALMCSRDWLLANRHSPIMDEECREEMNNLMHSQSILTGKSLTLIFIFILILSILILKYMSNIFQKWNMENDYHSQFPKSMKMKNIRIDCAHSKCTFISFI